MTRRKITIAITGLLLFGGVFAILPALVMQLNDSFALPCWRALPLKVLGLGLMVGAAAVYTYCATLFQRRGGGTPSPLYPPQQLVVTGLFAYSRNPIYVGYVAFLLGVFLFFGHVALLAYAALVAIAIHVVIVYQEEPELRRRFGSEYGSYARTVPRWLRLWRSRAPR